MHSLPDELRLIILAALDLDSLLAMSHVSRHYCGLVVSLLDATVTHVDRALLDRLRLRKPCSYARLVELLVARPAGLVERVDLSCFGTAHKAAVHDLAAFQRSLAAGAHRLVALDLSRWPVWNDNFAAIAAAGAISLTHVTLSFARVEDSSVAALFKYCTLLEHLDLSGCGVLNGACLATAQHVCRLRTLLLNGCPMLSLAHVASYVSDKRRLAARLTTFRIGCDLYTNEWSEPLQDSIAARLPTRLEHLVFSFRFKPCPASLGSLTGLVSLDLSWCTLAAADDSLPLVLNRCTRLRKLTLGLVTNLTDRAFTTLPIRAPLVELDTDLSRAPAVTDATLCALGGAHLATTLAKLNVNTCSRLTGPGCLRLLEEAGALRQLRVGAGLLKDRLSLRQLVQYMNGGRLCEVYFDARLGSHDVRQLFRDEFATAEYESCAALERLYLVDRYPETFHEIRRVLIRNNQLVVSS